jgi:hypothetical protein
MREWFEGGFDGEPFDRLRAVSNVEPLSRTAHHGRFDGTQT